MKKELHKKVKKYNKDDKRSKDQSRIIMVTLTPGNKTVTLA